METDGDGVDYEGRMWRNDEEPISLPDRCRAKATILLNERAGQWRYGYEIKWPGNGKGDGWAKVLPNINGPGHEDRLHARLLCVQVIRGELEAKDFNGGYQAAALAALDNFIRQIGGMSPALTPSHSAGGGGVGPPMQGMKTKKMSRSRTAKRAAGTMETVRDTFGQSTQTVSGYAVAIDQSQAENFARTFKQTNLLPLTELESPATTHHGTAANGSLSSG